MPIKNDYEVLIEEMKIDPVKALKSRGFELTEKQIQELKAMPFHNERFLRKTFSKKAYGAIISGGFFW